MSIDMERQVRAYAEYLGSTLPVLEGYEAMVEPTGGPPAQPLRERAAKPAAPGWVWAAVAAAITIIIGVATVVLLRAGEPADVIQPAPTTIPASTTIAASTTLPESLQVETFTAVSVVGTWSWTQLDSAEQPQPLPDAFIGGEYFTDGEYHTDVLPTVEDYLVSSDGLRWSVGLLPAGAEVISVDSESVHAGAIEGSRIRVWRLDSGAWRELTLPELVLPAADGLSLVPELSSILVAGSTSIVIVEFVDELLYDQQLSPLTQHFDLADAEVLAIVEGPPNGPIELWRDEGEGTLLASIDVVIAEEAPPTVEFRDSATNELVHLVRVALPGLTADQLREALTSQDAVVQLALFSSTDGGGFVEVSDPFEWADATTRGDVEITTVNETVLALTAGHALWRSSNGTSWFRADVTGLPDLEEGSGELHGGGDRVFLIENERTWTSTDGRSWEEVDDLRGESRVRVVPAPTGWFATTGGSGFAPNHSAEKVFVSVDGLEWQQIETPPDLCQAVLHGATIHALRCDPADGAEEGGSFTRWTATLEGG